MKNENKIYDTDAPQYTCAICGKGYRSVSERMNCEMECLRKTEQAKKDTRFAEASAALDNALTLVNKCVEDYGSFKYSGKLKDLDLVNMDFFPSKLWHHFWV